MKPKLLVLISAIVLLLLACAQTTPLTPQVVVVTQLVEVTADLPVTGSTSAPTDLPAAEATLAPPPPAETPLIQFANATYVFPPGTGFTLPSGDTVTLEEGSAVVGEGDTAGALYLVDGFVADVGGEHNVPIALLSYNGGGSGLFLSLHAFDWVDGQLVNRAAVTLGDRQRVHVFAVRDGQVVLVLTTQGPSDPLCCGTQLIQLQYALTGGAWANTYSEVLGTIEGAP